MNTKLAQKVSYTAENEARILWRAIREKAIEALPSLSEDLFMSVVWEEFDRRSSDYRNTQKAGNDCFSGVMADVRQWLTEKNADTISFSAITTRCRTWLVLHRIADVIR